MDKPPILSTEQVIKWLKDNYGENAIIAPLAHGKASRTIYISSELSKPARTQQGRYSRR